MARAGLLKTGRGRIHDACGDNRPRGLNSYLFLLHFCFLSLFHFRVHFAVFSSFRFFFVLQSLGHSVDRSVVRSVATAPSQCY